MTKWKIFKYKRNQEIVSYSTIKNYNNLSFPMKKKINSKKRYSLFWITILSGSGKTTIAKKIFPTIKKMDTFNFVRW